MNTRSPPWTNGKHKLDEAPSVMDYIVYNVD